MSLQGYRRFKERTNVRLLENLIALIGQNESGKTSFLQSLEELNGVGKISEQDQTRRVDVTTAVSATFSLEETDLDKLTEVEEGENIEKCTFTKVESGEIIVEADPKPSHNHQPRKEMRTTLSQFSESEVFGVRALRNVRSNLKQIHNRFDSEKDYLGDTTISRIQETISKLDNVVENSDISQEEQVSIEEINENLRALLKHEKKPAPKQAREILSDIRPKFFSFDEEDRSLKSKYDLNTVLPNPPSALSNVAEMAGLDLQELKEAAEASKIHITRDMTENANEKLEKYFSQSWVRSDVVPVFDIDGTILHINVRTPDDGKRAPIHQRSDGLRWFVALVAFLNQENAGRNPILLVDEAERHLSYDAQAELVEVLETQTVAQKVIYSTHSAGCLPSDLGRGIRPVVQKEGERSDIENGFWTDEPGFKPIMVAMGLSPLAFTVARNSLIAEGPCETILLPTLIRQATGKSDIEYQVAPGAANVGEERISELLSETGRSLILLDGDGGGVENKDDLIEAGANPEKIKTYRDFSGEGLVLEDLIDPGKYAEAVNNEIEEWQETAAELEVDDIPDIDRVQAVEDWCNRHNLDTPSKVNVSQRLVKMASEGADIVCSEQKDSICQIDDWANSYFVDVSTS